MEQRFDWSEEKNRKLLRERNISFEAVVANIEEGHIVAVVPDRGKFSRQKQFLVAVDDYIYIVPFVESPDRIFLKTIIPSRKMTRLYLRGNQT